MAYKHIEALAKQYSHRPREALPTGFPTLNALSLIYSDPQLTITCLETPTFDNEIASTIRTVEDAIDMRKVQKKKTLSTISDPAHIPKDVTPPQTHARSQEITQTSLSPVEEGHPPMGGRALQMPGADQNILPTGHKRQGAQILQQLTYQGTGETTQHSRIRPLTPSHHRVV